MKKKDIVIYYEPSFLYSTTLTFLEEVTNEETIYFR